jgi:hypothetical protein
MVKLTEDVSKMSDEELRSHLLTSDYKGIHFKKLVLEELLKRQTKKNNDLCYWDWS